MKHIKLFEEYTIEESSGKLLSPKKGKWMKIKPRQHPELAGEFFDLINIEYEIWS